MGIRKRNLYTIIGMRNNIKVAQQQEYYLSILYVLYVIELKLICVQGQN